MCIFFIILQLFTTLMPVWATKLLKIIAFVSAKILLFEYYSAAKYVTGTRAYFHDEKDEKVPWICHWNG